MYIYRYVYVVYIDIYMHIHDIHIDMYMYIHVVKCIYIDVYLWTYNQ